MNGIFAVSSGFVPPPWRAFSGSGPCLRRCGITKKNAKSSFDRALELAGGLDFQLLGLGFNGHIAFNEPRSPKDISTADYATLPSRLLRLDPRTVEQNRVLTAGGDASLVPPCAATMGMKQILAAKRCLLLCCFAEQSAPLKKVLELREPTPELPGSFLAFHPDCRAIYTTDLVHPF